MFGLFARKETPAAKPVRAQLAVYRDLLMPAFFMTTQEPQADRTMMVDFLADFKNDRLLLRDVVSGRQVVLFTRDELDRGVWKTESRYRMQKFIFKRDPWPVWTQSARGRALKPVPGEYRKRSCIGKPMTFQPIAK